MDKLSKEQRTRNMKAVKSKGSKIETKLSKALWHKGYRFKKNDNTVFGKPDIVFKGFKIAIFCDSEFWHGKDWGNKKKDHKSNVVFWHNKIERNIERDKEVNSVLEKQGWHILRFWGKDINKHLEECIELVNKTINEKRKNNIQ